MKKEERLNYFKSLIGKESVEDMPLFTRWLGAVIRDAKEGEFTVEFVVRPEMTNPLGMLHGGMHAAIIDDVIGMTVFALGNESHFISVNLSVDFLGRAKIGDKVTAKSRVVRRGKQVINITCELFDEKGSIISRGTSNMLKTNVGTEQ
jgi:acyl-coenzyme A thioesterase 13